MDANRRDRADEPLSEGGVATQLQTVTPNNRSHPPVSCYRFHDKYLLNFNIYLGIIIKTIYYIKNILILVSFIFLTACSSMLNRNDFITDNNTSSSLKTISLLPARRQSLPNYTATGNFTADMVNWLNTVRETVGLFTLPVHPSVQQAAQNHSYYQVANHTNGHYEVPGMPYFTGEKPGKRISSVYRTRLVGEVTIYYTGYGKTALATGVQAVQSLIDAPFHRVLIFSNFGVIGAGYDSDYMLPSKLAHTGFDIDFADTAETLAENSLVVYPFASQKDVPISWYAKEDPNPFRNLMSYIGKTVGYPVTIQGNLADRLVISSFIITTNGVNVPCHEVDSSTELIRDNLPSAAVCIPYQPYTPNTQYTATVTGTKNNQPFTVTWSWTTTATIFTTSLATTATCTRVARIR
jgi:uncharacterized protein YkwD